MPEVICQEWIEHESGWGMRNDGCSLHIPKHDIDAYIKEREVNDRSSDGKEFVRVGDRKILEISDELFAQVSESEKGISLAEDQYRALLNT